MSRDFNKKIIVGLDIGTSKVVAVVAESLPEEGGFDVIGVGQAVSKGMRRGVVVNIEQTVGSIQQALEEAELMADCKIREVYTGIGGNHISSFNSSGMVAVADKEVSETDTQRVIETAQAVNIPAEHQVLHVITQHFRLDKQEGIVQPKGMAGIRLEVRVHIVTGLQSVAQNIVKCVRRCGLEVNDLILQPLAASQVCLTSDEKELGVALVDIGSGTTGVAIFHGGSVRHTDVIDQGGDLVTNDIATILRTPTVDAEDIKLNFGVALHTLVDPDETFEIQGLGDRDVRLTRRQELSEVIEARVEEILNKVADSIASSDYRDKVTGIVLTGGTALMPGIVELAEETFGQPVRIGVPLYDGHLSDIVCTPRLATVMGLVMEARLQQDKEDYRRPSNNIFSSVVNFVKSMF